MRGKQLLEPATLPVVDRPRLGIAGLWIAAAAEADEAGDVGTDLEQDAFGRRRDRATRVAHGAFTGAANAPTVGVVLHVRGRDSVVATPAPGGGGVAWRVRL